MSKVEPIIIVTFFYCCKKITAMHLLKLEMDIKGSLQVFGSGGQRSDLRQAPVEESRACKATRALLS